MSITVDMVYDGEVLRPDKPLDLTPHVHYSVTIGDAIDVQTERGDAWAVLQSLIGTVDGPIDWSTEHDHYIYGSAKRGTPQDG
jgi:hypothetical protein